jgi:anti-sigma factor (TIGR02949 family)
MIFDGLKRLLGLDGAGNEAPAGSNGGSPGERGSPDGREMISCHEAMTRLQEFVDGELHGLTHEQVEEHFKVCTRCYPHLKMEESFRQRVQTALAQPEVPSDLRDRVLQLLAQDDEADG